MAFRCRRDSHPRSHRSGRLRNAISGKSKISGRGWASAPVLPKKWPRHSLPRLQSEMCNAGEPENQFGYRIRVRVRDRPRGVRGRFRPGANGHRLSGKRRASRAAKSRDRVAADARAPEDRDSGPSTTPGESPRQTEASETHQHRRTTRAEAQRRSGSDSVRLAAARGSVPIAQLRQAGGYGPMSPVETIARVGGTDPPFKISRLRAQKGRSAIERRPEFAE